MVCLLLHFVFLAIRALDCVLLPGASWAVRGPDHARRDVQGLRRSWQAVDRQLAVKADTDNHTTDSARRDKTSCLPYFLSACL
jgi:hypothetical protein